MKKAITVLMVFCLMAGWVGAVKVDDFNNYAIGAVDTVTTNWKTFGTAGTVAIAVDPADSTNKVLDYTETTGSFGGYGILTGQAIIANGQTKTLFFRFRQNAVANSCVALTDLDAPAANTWDQQFNVARFFGGGIQVIGTVTPLAWDPGTPAAVTNNTWYNMWIVTNHTANTYRVYMNTIPGGNANATTDHVGLLANNPFRKSTTDALDRFHFLSWGSAHIYFDDIHVMPGTDLGNPMKSGAHDPTPADGEANVLTTTATLSWLTGEDPNIAGAPNPNITKHYVYMKEGEPNFISVAPITVDAGDPVQAGASCAMPLTLAIDKTYYWRVDESIHDSSPADGNTIQGATWTFTSQKSIPIITTQPVDTSVSVPAAASFTTVFTSISAPTVVWKKNGAIVSSGVVTTGPVGITYTTTLSFASTSDSDQAVYTCELTNLSGQPAVVSDPAKLVTRKLLAHYQFEDNLNDSSTFDPHHAAGMLPSDSNTPQAMTFTASTGLLAGTKALVLDGTAVAVLGTEGYPKTGLGNGLEAGTISCFVKAASVGGLFANYNDNILENLGAVPPQPAANTTGFGIELADPGLGRIHMRGEIAGPPIAEAYVGEAQGAPDTTPAFNMLDGNWHQVAAAWTAGGPMIVYVDGVQVASTNANVPETFAPWQRGNVIGGIRTIANRSAVAPLFRGAIDDLRVYNYAMTAHELVDEIYYPMTGKSVCTETYPTAYDVNGDCVLDLGDFVLLAANWLKCGLYPVEVCP